MKLWIECKHRPARQVPAGIAPRDRFIIFENAPGLKGVLPYGYRWWLQVRLNKPIFCKTFYVLQITKQLLRQLSHNLYLEFERNTGVIVWRNGSQLFFHGG